jgi:hypothetical protein
MAAFGERFGFQFVAHAIGNANRSGRVERPFHFTWIMHTISARSLARLADASRV